MSFPFPVPSMNVCSSPNYSYPFSSGLSFLHMIMSFFENVYYTPKMITLLHLCCSLQMTNSYNAPPSTLSSIFTITGRFDYPHFSVEDAKALRDKMVFQGHSFMRGQHQGSSFATEYKWSFHYANPLPVSAPFTNPLIENTLNGFIF